MAQQHNLRKCFPAALALVACGIAVFPADTPAPAKLPFTLSPETTIISSPLQPDGAPDYLRAINEKYAKGVTPENNGFALMLQVLGTRVADGIVASTDHERLLAMLGIPENAADRPIYQFPIDFWKGQGLDDNVAAALEEHMLDLRKLPWREADETHIAEYLQSQKRFLDAVGEAAARPKWWSPLVSNDGTMTNFILPSLGRLKGLTIWVAVRGMGRFTAGDFDGFLSDVQAVKRLGRRMTQTATLIELLVGNAIESSGDAAIAAAADSGKMTQAQSAALLAMLNDLPARTPASAAVNVGARWQALDLIAQIALGNADRMKFFDENQQTVAFTAIDHSRVDWDISLRQMNAIFDQFGAIMNSPDVATVNQRGHAFDQQEKEWRSAVGMPADLTPKDKETREAYSKRVAEGVYLVALPSLERVREMEMRTEMSDAMARMLVAAAAVKAKTGKWPEKAADLLAGGLKALPRDPYSAQGKGTEPLKYVMTDFGPRVYSIGANMRDDGGQRGNEQDDNFLGGEPPPGVTPIPSDPDNQMP